MTTVKMIAAMSRKTRAIGTESGEMPWQTIREDMRHFKKTTMGHPVVMGRKTWESFHGYVLPGRTNIVVTSNADYEVPDDVIVAGSVKDALQIASAADDEIFVIGGGEVYKASLPYTKYLYLTVIYTDADGPVKFPNFGHRDRRTTLLKKSSDENYSYEFNLIRFSEVKPL